MPRTVLVVLWWRRGAVLLSLFWLGCDPVVVDAVDPRQEDAGGGAVEPPFYDSVVHRYGFDRIDDVVVDSVGGADGVIVNEPLAQTAGVVTLTGGTRDTGGYVDLPGGLLSVLDSATLETWLTWQGQSEWQRIFDIGSGAVLEGDDTESGVDYLFATPLTAQNTDGVLRATYRPSREAGVGETIANGSRPLPEGTMVHFAVVVDSEQQRLFVYVDGTLAAATELVEPLSAIDDVDTWLGRSHFALDDAFDGVFHEFRIHASALTPDQLRDSLARGPDASFDE